jgi:hypothetical protein
MTQPLLSILIPTVVGRESELQNLLNNIKKHCVLDIKSGMIKQQYVATKYDCEEIEVIIVKDSKTLTIGEKREIMYNLANGTFSWQIDDDDDISSNAIELILEAIKSNPEIPTITFRERCMMNGVYQTSNHSIKYDKWQDNFDGYNYVRTPFYKDVIRTDIAQSVPFPKIRYNEDEQWSYAIKPLLTDEIHIDEEIYYYIYEPKDTHNERYGIIH